MSTKKRNTLFTMALEDASGGDPGLQQVETPETTDEFKGDVGNIGGDESKPAAVKPNPDVPVEMPTTKETKIEGDEVSKTTAKPAMEDENIQAQGEASDQAAIANGDPGTTEVPTPQTGEIGEPATTQDVTGETGANVEPTPTPATESQAEEVFQPQGEGEGQEAPLPVNQTDAQNTTTQTSPDPAKTEVEPTEGNVPGQVATQDPSTSGGEPVVAEQGSAPVEAQLDGEEVITNAEVDAIAAPEETLQGSAAGLDEARREVEELNTQIDDAEEATGRIEELREQVEASQAEQGGMRRLEAAAVGVALEAIKSRIGMSGNVGRPMPALESFGGVGSRDRATKAALESFTDTVKAIWDRIVKAVRGMAAKMWAYAEKIFVRTKSIKANARALKQRLNGVKQETPAGESTFNNKGLFQRLNTKGQVGSILGEARKVVDISREALMPNQALIGDNFTAFYVGASSGSAEGVLDVFRSKGGSTTFTATEEGNLVMENTVDLPGNKTAFRRLLGANGGVADLPKVTGGVAEAEHPAAGDGNLPYMSKQDVGNLLSVVELLANTAESFKGTAQKTKQLRETLASAASKVVTAEGGEDKARQQALQSAMTAANRIIDQPAVDFANYMVDFADAALQYAAICVKALEKAAPAAKPAEATPEAAMESFAETMKSAWAKAVAMIKSLLARIKALVSKGPLSDATVRQLENGMAKMASAQAASDDSSTAGEAKAVAAQVSEILASDKAPSEAVKKLREKAKRAAASGNMSEVWGNAATEKGHAAAMEGYSAVALESFKDTVKAAWEKAMAFLKATWEKALSLFKSKDATDAQKKAVKQNLLTASRNAAAAAKASDTATGGKATETLAEFMKRMQRDGDGPDVGVIDKAIFGILDQLNNPKKGGNENLATESASVEQEVVNLNKNAESVAQQPVTDNDNSPAATQTSAANQEVALESYANPNAFAGGVYVSMEAFGDNIKEVWENVTSKFMAFLEKAKNWISNKFDALKKSGSEGAKKAADGLKNMLSSLKRRAQSLFNVKERAEKQGNVSSALKATWDKVVAAMKDMRSAIAAKFGNGANETKDVDATMQLLGMNA